MCNLTSELIAKIDGVIRNHPRAFCGAAKILKRQFHQTNSLPLFSTLCSTAKMICEAEFNNDYNTARLILLITWMTNKKDADLKPLDLTEFTTWDNDLGAGRAFARAVICTDKVWPELVKNALSVVESELQHKKIKGWRRMLKKNRKYVVVILTIVGIVIGILANVKYLREPSPKRGAGVKPHTLDPNSQQYRMSEPNRADFNTFQRLLKEHRDFQQKQLTGIKSVLLDQLARRIIGIASSSTLPTNSSGLGESLERRLASEILVIFAKSYREFGFAEPNNMKGYLAPASNKFLPVWVEVREETIFFRSSLFRDEAVLPYVKDYSPKLRSLVTLEKSTEQERIKLIEDLDNLIFLQDKLYSSVIFDVDRILKQAYNQEFDTQSKLSEKQLLSLTRRYFTEKRKQSSDESTKTLYDKIIKWGKNNLLVVTISMALIVIAGAAAFKRNLKTLFSRKKTS